MTSAADSASLVSSLQYPCTASDLAEARRILAKPAALQVNITDDSGRTPLHLAAGIGDEAADIVESLLSRGAAVNAYNTHGFTPLQKAVLGNHKGVALALIEPRYARHRPERAVAHVVQLIRYVAGHASLRALFGIAVTVGVATFVPVWLVQLYATDAGVALSWLGPIWAIANYVVSIGSALSDRTGRALGLNGVMLACVGLLAVGYFGMGLTTAWWGFVFYFCFNLVRGLSAPLIAHAEQDAIPSGDRASLVSMRSLLFRAAFIAVGPAAGAAVDAHGHHPVLLALGVALVTLSLVAWLVLIRVPIPPARPTQTHV